MRRVVLVIATLTTLASAAVMRTNAVQVSKLPDGFVEGTPITGFNRPIAIVWLPDGRMLVGEKFGSIRMVQGEQLRASPVVNIAVTRMYDAGLLGIAVDPNFSTQPYIYVYYTVGTRSLNYQGVLHNRVSRFRMEGDQALLQSEQILIDDINVDTTSNHNGGDLQFGDDGTLYISVGDVGRSETAQDLDSPHGKILRVDPETGLGLMDNPFHAPGNSVQRNRVWAYGLRNPFRFTFAPDSEMLYVGDVGWQTYEELNLVGVGRNYGWPMQEGPNKPGALGVEEPLFSYARSYNPDKSLDDCTAIIGGDFVRGENFPASMQGVYFFADYTCQRIWYKKPGAAPTLFTREAGNIAHLAFGPDGALYYTDILANTLRRIYFAEGNRPPTAYAQATPRIGVVPLAVAFTSHGSADPDGGELRYLWDFGDGTTSAEPAPEHLYTKTEPVTATLTVTDEGGATVRALPIRLWPGDTAPLPVIEAPADGMRIRAGTAILLQGAATDAEDGDLTGDALRWEAVLHHGTSHTHLWDVGTGGTFRIVMPAPEDLVTAGASYLEVSLTAEDQEGATSSHTIRLLPDTVTLTFQTEPSGMEVQLDGRVYRTPVMLEAAKGWAFSVSDYFQATGDCQGYTFERWSNNRPPSHLLVTPNVDMTLTGTLRQVPLYCYHLPLLMH